MNHLTAFKLRSKGEKIKKKIKHSSISEKPRSMSNSSKSIHFATPTASPNPTTIFYCLYLETAPPTSVPAMFFIASFARFHEPTKLIELVI